MARKGRKILKWFSWIFMGFMLFMALITLIFYLFRGRIKDEAVNYFNNIQEGELQVGKISFIPLMDFPDVTLKVKEVQYLGAPDSLTGGVGSTILMLEGFSVSLDLFALIKGEYRFSGIEMDGGIVRLKFYKDGATNFEKALGNLLESDESSSDTISSPVRLDLERVGIKNLILSFENELLNTSAGLQINQLLTGLSYYPEIIRSTVDLDLTVNTLSSDYYSFNNPRELRFHGGVLYDQPGEILTIDPSSLSLKQTEMEVWGSYNLGEEAFADITFRARNSGLELLNFLLNGVLDLDDLEQTGSGSIYLSGTVKGSFGKELPDIKVNFGASGLGFRIKEINKSIENISFTGFLNNGKKADYSEAVAIINRLHAELPDGELNGSLMLENLLEPKIDLSLDASASLEGLEKMLADSIITELKGSLKLSADMKGQVNIKQNTFLSDSSRLNLTFSGLSCQLPGRKINNLNGRLWLKGRELGLDNFEIQTDSMSVLLNARTSNVVTALLGYNEAVAGDLQLSSAALSLAEITGDTTYLEEPWGIIKGLDLKCSFSSGEHLLSSLGEKGIPDHLRLTVQNLSGEIRGTEPLKNFSGELKLEGENIFLERFKGDIGTTSLGLTAGIENFTSLYDGDTLHPVIVNINMNSDCIFAKDVLCYDGEFMLPQSYIKDRFDRFSLSANLVFPEGTFADSIIDPDFSVALRDIHFNWSAYPYEVSELNLDARRNRDHLAVERLEGKIGKSQIRLEGFVDNFLDSLTTSMKGEFTLSSEVIDLDEILNVYYSIDEEEPVTASSIVTTGEEEESFFAGLSHYSYPDIHFNLALRKILYETAIMSNLKGQLHISDTRVFELDSLSLNSSSGGSLLFNGQFSVFDPKMYILGASVDIRNFDIKDINLDMEYDDRHYSLQENFAGIVSVKGLTELYITPEMSLDMGGSTAFLNLSVKDGQIKNFAPLHELARYFGNKDLDDVRFAELNNNFTLLDGRVYIPNTSIGSTIGQIIIEGEHGFDNTYDYRLRLPPELVKGAAWSAMTYREGKDRDGKDEIQNETSGRFLIVNIIGNGDDIDIKVGDKNEDRKDKGK